MNEREIYNKHRNVSDTQPTFANNMISPINKICMDNICGISSSCKIKFKELGKYCSIIRDYKKITYLDSYRWQRHCDIEPKSTHFDKYNEEMVDIAIKELREAEERIKILMEENKKKKERILNLSINQ